VATGRPRRAVWHCYETIGSLEVRFATREDADIWLSQTAMIAWARAQTVEGEGISAEIG
jgi:hypothetical protein